MYVDDFEQYIINKYDNKQRLTEEDIKTLAWDYQYAKKEGENRRWTRTVTVIVELKGRFFQIEYEEGLTEYQENYYYNTDIAEVKPIETTIVVKDWVKI